jgi:hypothetical protein
MTAIEGRVGLAVVIVVLSIAIVTALARGTSEIS